MPTFTQRRPSQKKVEYFCVCMCKMQGKIGRNFHYHFDRKLPLAVSCIQINQTDKWSGQLDLHTVALGRPCLQVLLFIMLTVPMGSPSHGGDVAAYVFTVSQPSLPTPFYSVLVAVSVFMAASTVFHSTNSPDKSALSGSVLPVSFLPYWSFQLYIFL